MYSARFDTRQACRHTRPERRTHADDDNQDDGADPGPARRYSARRLAPGSSGAAAIADCGTEFGVPACRAPRRYFVRRPVPVRSRPVSRPRAMLPLVRAAFDAVAAATAIGWRAVGVRRQQSPARNAPNVSTAGHGSLLSGGFLWGNQRERRLSHGRRHVWGLGGHPAWAMTGRSRPLRSSAIVGCWHASVTVAKQDLAGRRTGASITHMTAL